MVVQHGIQLASATPFSKDAWSTDSSSIQTIITYSSLRQPSAFSKQTMVARHGTSKCLVENLLIWSSSQAMPMSSMALRKEEKSFCALMATPSDPQYLVMAMQDAWNWLYHPISLTGCMHWRPMEITGSMVFTNQPIAGHLSTWCSAAK